MTPEQTGALYIRALWNVRIEEGHVAQMEDGLERVRIVLGSEAESGLSDGIVKETLWESYFNVDEAIDWLVRAYHLFNI